MKKNGERKWGAKGKRRRTDLVCMRSRFCGPVTIPVRQGVRKKLLLLGSIGPALGENVNKIRDVIIIVVVNVVERVTTVHGNAGDRRDTIIGALRQCHICGSAPKDKNGLKSLKSDRPGVLAPPEPRTRRRTSDTCRTSSRLYAFCALFLFFCCYFTIIFPASFSCPGILQ